MDGTASLVLSLYIVTGRYNNLSITPGHFTHLMDILPLALVCHWMLHPLDDSPTNNTLKQAKPKTNGCKLRYCSHISKKLQTEAGFQIQTKPLIQTNKKKFVLTEAGTWLQGGSKLQAMYIQFPRFR